MKKALPFLLFVSLCAPALADAPRRYPAFPARDVTALVETTSGAVYRPTQIAARAFCDNQGLQLPTAWDLAVFAQRFGMRVRKTQHPGKLWGSPEVQHEIYAMYANRFTPVNSMNAAGDMIVDFYFNNTSYVCPREWCLNWLWSSTPGPHARSANFFNGQDGFIGPGTSDSFYPSLSAMVCLE